MKNTIILATDTLIARTYIQALKDAGMEPGLVVFLQIIPSGQSRVKSLLKDLKAKIKSFLKKSPPLPSWLPLFCKYCKAQELFFPDYRKEFATLLRESGFKYRTVRSTGVDDPSLIRLLESQVKEKFIVFCCGGMILRDPILNGSKRFIHVHPGLVPEVKGSDGMLWSSLIYKKVGMSAFFMNAGIDTGDILKRKEYPIPKLPIEDDNCDLASMADEFVRYIDPVYRANLLVELFQDEEEPGNWKMEKQDPESGKVFYFMDKQLKEIAGQRFLKSL